MSLFQKKLFESSKRTPPTRGDRWIICVFICGTLSVLNLTAIDIVANSAGTRFLEWLETIHFALPYILILGPTAVYGTVVAFLPRWFSYVIFPVLLAFPAAAHIATGLVALFYQAPYFNQHLLPILVIICLAFPFCLFVSVYISRELWIANLRAEAGEIKFLPDNRWPFTKKAFGGK